MIFCEIVVSMEMSIPDIFYCYMATRFLRADVWSCQKLTWGGGGGGGAQVVLEKVA
jgi:hypothetical protein